MPAEPTLETEAELFGSGARYVIGCDEVGRGAIAGPVAVGLCVVDERVGRMPDGLRDSKLLTERRREAMAPLATSWALRSAVGLASAEEIDRLGITACLGLAGARAIAALEETGVGIREGVVVLLDGHHDWLSPALASAPTARLAVRTRIKADRDCASVAAASVIAKVHRDRLMIEADALEPGYGWRGNKGYGSAGHFEAIERLGVSSIHRRTWLRPTALPEPDAAALPGSETAAALHPDAAALVGRTA
jgi:ribonuclease HII